jgi:putative spermidine/putrescine transport system permease protein
VRRAGRIAVSTLLSAVVLVPFAVMLVWSFSHRWFYPDLLPRDWSLRAWRYVFQTAGPQILPSLVQSTLVSALTAAVAVALGLPAGRVLGLYHFRGKDLISVVLMVPVIVPPLSVAMGLHGWFLRLDLADSILGVVLVHLTFCLPYTVFVMWGVFANTPADYELQARTLGANRLQVWRRVILPMALPGVVVAALFAFLLSWSQYLSTLIIGGGRVVTLPILLFSLMGSGDRPVAAAVALVFVAPALAALVLSTRHIAARRLPGVW